jgi:hypothetical protein
MTANPSHRSVIHDELAVRLARLGLPAGSVRDRRAALPTPLRELHRRLLGIFLTGTGPPDRAVVARMAIELGLDHQPAVDALAAADVVRTDPATGRISVAYPFSGRPTPHRVELAGGTSVHAMCALDALGIPQMARRDGRIGSTDPANGRPVTVEVHGGVWTFEPATTVVLLATAATAEACGPVGDCCCPHMNFHVEPRHAEAYLHAHPGMTAELLDQAEAVTAAGRIFGHLLDPDDDHSDSWR